MIRLLLVISVLAASSTHAQDLFDRYFDSPVPVRNANGQELRLVGIEGNLVELSSRNFDVSQDIEAPNFALRLRPTQRYGQGRVALTTDQPERAIELMAPIAIPLFRYLSVPEEKFSIHSDLERYMRVLIDDEEYLDTARKLYREIDFDEAPRGFISMGLDLAKKLFTEGQGDEAYRLLRRLPDIEGEVYIDFLLSFANELRTSGLTEQAFFMYQQVADKSESEEKRRIAQLWMAYVNMEVGRTQLAGILLDDIGELGPKDGAYPLVKLIRGRSALEDGKVGEGMRAISQGVVAADLGSAWTPELIFNSGRGYEKMAEDLTIVPGAAAELNEDEIERQKRLRNRYLTAANEIYKEVRLLYPDSVWAELSQTRLAELPEPDPSIEESTGG